MVRLFDHADRPASTVLATIGDAIVVRGPDGQVVDWNAAAETLLGLSRRLDGQGDPLSLPSVDPSIGAALDGLWPAVHEDGTPWPAQNHPALQALRHGQPVRHQVMGLDRPGRDRVWLNVSATPISGPDGGVVTCCADITEARRATAALRTSAHLQRATLDALDQGIVLAHQNGDLEVANPACERILGFTASELAQRWKSGRWTTWDRDGRVLPAGERPLVRAATTGEAIYDAEVWWERGDGARILLRLSVVPVPGLDGAGDLIVVAFTDITEEHRTKQLLDATFSAAPVGLAVLDDHRRVVRANSAYAEQMGLDPRHRARSSTVRSRRRRGPGPGARGLGAGAAQRRAHRGPGPAGAAPRC